jgi:hypothetical protein
LAVFLCLKINHTKVASRGALAFLGEDVLMVLLGKSPHPGKESDSVNNPIMKGTQWKTKNVPVEKNYLSS